MIPSTGEKATDANPYPGDPDSKDFYAQLVEAQSTDLSDLDRIECVKLGKDLKNLPVLVVIPTLALRTGDQPEEVFRRILLLFIVKAHEIINLNYSIVYAHTDIDFNMNQYPLIYKFYSILPREYKKNIVKMYVIHPNMGLRMFFEFTRVFLSTKFYAKLTLLDSILDFQKIIPPTLLTLPWKFLRKEDEMKGLKFLGRMAPLSQSFDPSLGTTRTIHSCITYLRAKNAVKQKGIFRVAGDEGELQLAKLRLQYADHSSHYQERIILSENQDYMLLGDLDALTRKPISVVDQQPKQKHRNSFRLNTSANSSNAKSGVSSSTTIGNTIKETTKESSDDTEVSEEIPLSLVVVKNVNTVAQILKMSISHLPESLVSSECYKKLIDSARKYENGGTSQEWEKQCSLSLSQLLFEHLSTLVHLVNFLREVCRESAVNSMDSSNLAIIFAPTIFLPEMIDPMKAVMELKLSKTIVKDLIDIPTILQYAMYLHEQSNPTGEQRFLFPIDKSLFQDRTSKVEESLLCLSTTSLEDISAVRHLTYQFSDRFLNRITHSSNGSPCGTESSSGSPDSSVWKNRLSRSGRISRNRDEDYDPRDDPRVSIVEDSVDQQIVDEMGAEVGSLLSLKESVTVTSPPLPVATVRDDSKRVEEEGDEEERGIIHHHLHSYSEGQQLAVDDGRPHADDDNTQHDA